MTPRGRYLASITSLFTMLGMPAYAQLPVPNSVSDYRSTPIFDEDNPVKLGDESAFESLLSRARLSTDIRFRYQFLEQDDFELNADSATLRVHSALEFDLTDKTTFLVEGEGKAG